MDEETYNMLVQRAKDEGYDVSRLHKTPHPEPMPESNKTPDDAKGIWWFKSMFGK